MNGLMTWLKNYSLVLLGFVLFCLLFAVFVLAKLPAGWVLSQWAPQYAWSTQSTSKHVSQNGIVVAWDEPKGTLWQGQVVLKMAPAKQDNQPAAGLQGFDFGHVAWQWNPLGLITGEATVALSWDMNQSGLRSTVDYAWWSQTLQVSDSVGRIDLAELSAQERLQTLAQTPLLKSLQGVVDVQAFAAQWALNDSESWPQAFHAQLDLIQIQWQGNELKTLQVDLSALPEQTPAPIQATFSSSETAWNLNGEVTLQPNLSYNGRMTLQLNPSAASESLPNWGYLMQQKSATQYESLMRGQL